MFSIEKERMEAKQKGFYVLVYERERWVRVLFSSFTHPSSIMTSFFQYFIFLLSTKVQITRYSYHYHVQEFLPL
jgi:hypothetical protein